ncbi:hypothetical protein [Streptomyces ureilyticus]|uniref:Integral membrane protein n=1 Tax=Streptomyces ureilyticus TaxID=1775131 RepID=A0ABX0DGD3_9ACTN|nr:hypothetical protein [Streptomyces ureilyticus]NGO40627.1 hypothetical protein [Streptomyces ureilyticus]
MTTGIITVVNLIIAAATLGLGTVKARAARDQREWTQTLTASVLVFAGLIFLLATPVVYRIVGTVLRSPNIGALLVPVATLVCVAHAHALSQLWQPEQRDPAVLHRTAWRWGPVYGGAITAMTVLYFHADLGPAAPLKFAAAYAHVPEVVALHLIYWTALIVTVVVTVRACRSLSIPGRPDLVENLRKALGWFALALGWDLVNVALTAAALIGSATGPRRLDGLAESAWLATIASCIAANIALASQALRSRRAERRDLRALQPLHDLVIEDDDKGDPTVVLAPRWSWTGFGTQLDLNDMMAEVSDGMGRLSPWWSPMPSLAVNRLVTVWGEDGDDLGAGWDLTAAQAAATLLRAAQDRTDNPTTLPPQIRLPRLPGTDVEPHDERQHLVRVAQHLTHPLVIDAVAIAGEAQAATSAPRQ